MLLTSAVERVISASVGMSLSSSLKTHASGVSVSLSGTLFVNLTRVFHGCHCCCRRGFLSPDSVNFLAAVAALTFKLDGTVLVRCTLSFSIGLALALPSVEPTILRCVARSSADETSLGLALSFANNQHPSGLGLYCWVPTRLFVHLCRRSGQTGETLICSDAPLGTSHSLGLLPTEPHFKLTQEHVMPELRSSCRPKRFQGFLLRTPEFVVPTRSVDPGMCSPCREGPNGLQCVVQLRLAGTQT